jgi:hypothetical protein
VEIAQAALAVLDVGLQAVARAAQALVAGGALGQLGLDKAGRAARTHDVALEPLAETAIEILVAPQPACLQEAGANGQIGLGLAHAVVDRAGRVADLEAQVPEEIENLLDHLLATRGQLVGQ